MICLLKIYVFNENDWASIREQYTAWGGWKVFRDKLRQVLVLVFV